MSNKNLPEVVNLQHAFSKFSDHWSPRIAAELNGQHVKLAKLKGEFVWHHHDHEDEMFLIVSGSLDIEFESGTIHLDEGEFCVIPKGVEHRPIAEKEVHVLLFEPMSTLNTGQVRNELTKTDLDQI